MESKTARSAKEMSASVRCEGYLHRLLWRSIALACSVLADVIRDAHGAELGATHGAEVRQLGPILRKRLVVESL